MNFSLYHWTVWAWGQALQIPKERPFSLLLYIVFICVQGFCFLWTKGFRILYIKYLVRLSVCPWRSSGPSQTDDRARPDKTGSRSCPAVLLRGEDPVFAGPGPGTPGVRCVGACARLSRSWNPGPEGRISRSWNPVSVYRGPGTQVLRAKCGNTAATEEGSRVRLSESWNPAVAAPNRFSG
jgi:hypothetical protein